jgi:hypothetical protein
MLKIIERLNILVRKQIPALLQLEEVCFSFTQNHRNHQTESPSAGRLSIVIPTGDAIHHFNARLESRYVKNRLEQWKSPSLLKQILLT